jgi:hypothetical protein
MDKDLRAIKSGLQIVCQDASSPEAMLWLVRVSTAIFLLQAESDGLIAGRFMNEKVLTVSEAGKERNTA